MLSLSKRGMRTCPAETAQVSAHTTMITIATHQTIAGRGNDPIEPFVCLPGIRRAYAMIAAEKPKRKKTLSHAAL